MKDFEKSFSDFIDGKEYDQAEEALFSIVRKAYIAGWKAAGGEFQQPQKPLQLVRPERVIPFRVCQDSIETDATVEN